MPKIAPWTRVAVTFEREKPDTEVEDFSTSLHLESLLANLQDPDLQRELLKRGLIAQPAVVTDLGKAFKAPEHPAEVEEFEEEGIVVQIILEDDIDEDIFEVLERDAMDKDRGVDVDFVDYISFLGDDGYFEFRMEMDRVRIL